MCNVRPPRRVFPGTMYLLELATRALLRGLLLRVRNLGRGNHAIEPALIYTPAQFSSTIDGTGADGPRSEGGRTILLDNSRVYVRFHPFVSGRGHLER